jgi:hypothetical protein
MGFDARLPGCRRAHGQWHDSGDLAGLVYAKVYVMISSGFVVS